MKHAIFLIILWLISGSSSFSKVKTSGKEFHTNSFSEIYLRSDGSLKLVRFFSELYEIQEFESHIKPEQFYGTYLIHKVSFNPVNRIKKAIEKIKGIQLVDRGEAHITVVTPPEHDAIQKAVEGFSMERVERFVRDKIQNLNWDTPGVGAARGLNPDGKYTEVYFLVARSSDLRMIRQEIAERFKIPVEIFDPTKQDFHVTIGFTESDLHGIPKNESTLQGDLGFDQLFRNGL